MNPPADETLFAEALALPPADRTAYLDRACGNDPALRARVAALLSVAESARHFMEASPVAAAAETQRAAPAAAQPEEQAGDRIGRYKILQKIGEGGCGVVYVAEQEEPVRRRVALKVIKLGMDTREVIARFEAERQALALMDHPNIAKVLDAGATATGRPFFVMELVRGVPLTKYCDESNTPTGQRLELFIAICHAVQHAHQKGIIHRDLKPSNILVTINDGVPVPKIIDFGIAKATQGRLTDKTVYTAFEQFIGTPAYMSPEQAVMTSLDIDTRSDIYSLGVLLYELLTGRTPFDAKELVAAGLDEMRRRIREVEPPKPSTRLSTMEGEALTAMARLRHTEPPKLISLVRGDLDWIVMRCLEKDRTRRYDTANGLAEDIRRHLGNEPVSASPPSAAYRFQKLVRRHRTAFAAGTAIAAALVIGACVATWQAVRATRAEHRAQAERDATNQARRAEAGARALAERRRTEVETINKLILSDALGAADPEIGLGRDMTVRDVLDNVALRIPNAFADNALLEASLRATVGLAYLRLYLLDKAEPHLQAAFEARRRLLGEAHPDSLASLRDLGVLRGEQRKFDDSEKLLAAALAKQEQVLGADHEETLRTRLEYGGLKYVRMMYPMPPRERQALRTDLEQFARATHDKAVKRLGPEHALTLKQLEGLVTALTSARKFSEAEACARQLLTSRRRVLGPEHPETLSSMSILASLLGEMGKQAEAEKLLRENIALATRLLGPEHATTAITIKTLSNWLRLWNRKSEADDLLLHAATVYTKAFGMESPATAGVLFEVGFFLVEDGRAAEVRQFARDRLPDFKLQQPADSPGTAGLMWIGGLARLALGQPAEAEPLLRGYLVFREKQKGGWSETWKHSYAQSALGGALLAQGKYAEAEPLVVGGYEKMSERLSAGGIYRPLYWDALARVAELYTAWDKPTQATEWKKKLDELGPPPRRSPQMLPQPIAESVLKTKAPINLAFDPAPTDPPADRVTVIPPAGWAKTGNQVSSYAIGVDQTKSYRKPICAYVKSTRPAVVGLGGLNQSFAAERFRGQRVRFSVWIKTQDAASGAQLYLRIHRSDGTQCRFANMQGSPVRGTADWTQGLAELDVPEEAAVIVIGLFLNSTGHAWFNDAQFEVVGADVAVTNDKPMPSPASPNK